MKFLQMQKKQQKGTHDAGRYLLWLFIAVVIISIVSLVTTAYCTEETSRLLLDSINNSEVIYFDYGSCQLKEEAYPVLDKAAKMMNDEGALKLYITGYTDDRGSEGFNLELSLNRANAVNDYLITKGVNGENVIVSAMGKNEPVNGNSNDEERALNRRVIFSFTDPLNNTGKHAIDKFPGRRFYAEASLKTEYVNSLIKVNSRNEITADLSIRDSAGQPVDSIEADDISAILRWEYEGVLDSTEGAPRLIPINDKKKIAFTLTMDYSGSMYGVDSTGRDIPKSDKITAMERSVQLFIDQL
ncbi:MAG: OmpA family protein, partial [Ignavibacteria bacterium]|nr:OmpA family protein [Ignavibacteria bacterium]